MWEASGLFYRLSAVAFASPIPHPTHNKSVERTKFDIGNGGPIDDENVILIING